MIQLCERCFGPIEAHEAHVRLAHIDHANEDGSIVWVHSYVHTLRNCRLSTKDSAVTR
jgi:hypothetical protein